MRLKPSLPGFNGGNVTLDAPINKIICPECPWRKQMTPGYSIAYADDGGMLEAALNHHLPQKNFDTGEVTNFPAAQSCHMVIGSRCRGSEAFRANIGLDSTVKPNKLIAQSIDEAIAQWIRRGASRLGTGFRFEVGIPRYIDKP